MSLFSARALWLVPPHHAMIREMPLGARPADHLRVRTLYSAISKGTETLVYSGRVPESEYARMAAPFQAGQLPEPVRHGYANVGVVEEGPGDWPGRHVFCLFGHQSRFDIPLDAAIILPDDVPPARAVLAANLETAINALWDAPPRVGDRVTVVGAGVVGALVAALAADMPGVSVELVDIDRDRQPLARALGVDFATPDTAARARDLVFHASATEAGLNTAIDLAGAEAQITEMSWFGDKRPAIALGGAFHAKRLTLRATQVGTVAPSQAARWTHARRLALAVSLCNDSRLDALFNERDVVFDALPGVMARLAEPGDRSLCQRVTYSESA
ncbi:MAG: dehydrogenase [Xanthomonadales bacterium]|nr:dehydrogenase [Xanthomonadales bacterium]|tara:strand:+ start:280 stop:1269 length:990 start_codon:yes stop_codon:yes gene_type:complete